MSMTDHDQCSREHRGSELHSGWSGEALSRLVVVGQDLRSLDTTNDSACDEVAFARAPWHRRRHQGALRSNAKRSGEKGMLKGTDGDPHQRGKQNLREWTLRTPAVRRRSLKSVVLFALLLMFAWLQCRQRGYTVARLCICSAFLARKWRDYCLTVEDIAFASTLRPRKPSTL